MQQNIEFERCIDFLVRMIDKHGEEVLQKLEEEKQNNYFLLLQAYKDYIYFFT